MKDKQKYQIPENVNNFDPEKAYQELLRLKEEIAKIKAKYQ